MCMEVKKKRMPDHVLDNELVVPGSPRLMCDVARVRRVPAQ